MIWVGSELRKGKWAAAVAVVLVLCCAIYEGAAMSGGELRKRDHRSFENRNDAKDEIEIDEPSVQQLGEPGNGKNFAPPAPRGRSDITGSSVGLKYFPGTRWTHFFIAVNLFNNEEILPSFTASLEKLIQVYLLPHLASKLQIFISVFSNGSTDRTTELIEMLMAPRFVKLGVGLSVFSNGSCCGENIFARPKEMDRIVWMACVRNAALAPLFDLGLDVFGSNNSEPLLHLQHLGPYASIEEARMQHRQQVEIRTMSAVPSPRSGDNVAVLFFNDILFEPAEIVALLRTQRGGFDMSCAMDFYTTFYDTWVTRDIDGHRMTALPPYASAPRSQNTMWRVLGSRQIADVAAESNIDFVASAGVRVKCCWNGVAALRGSLFVEQGIRFRSAGKDRCFASECQLICEDIITSNILRKGRHRRGLHADISAREQRDAHAPIVDVEYDGIVDIFIHPLVKVAYEAPHYEFYHNSWWVRSGWLFTLLALFNVPSWPLWYWNGPADPILMFIRQNETSALPSAAEMGEKLMDCVDPRLVKNWGWVEYFELLCCFAVGALGWAKRKHIYEVVLHRSYETGNIKQD